jgi:outer membrane lipoprotein carrier protein
MGQTSGINSSFASLTSFYIIDAMKHVIGLLILSWLSSAPAVEDIALKVEKKLRSIQSIQSNFSQIYYSTSVSTPLEEKGKFYFKKPDLMKWEYKDPEEKIFLYKEGVFLLYIPEDKELFRSYSSKEKYESEILSLLSGKRRLNDNYLIEPSPFPSENEKAPQLKLTPREEGEYTHILLEIDEKTWLILRAIFFDWAGNKNEFKFSKIRTDVRLSKKVFELRVPPDVEIIEDVPDKKNEHP